MTINKCYITKKNISLLKLIFFYLVLFISFNHNLFASSNEREKKRVLSRYSPPKAIKKRNEQVLKNLKATNIIAPKFNSKRKVAKKNKLKMKRKQKSFSPKKVLTKKKENIIDVKEKKKNSSSILKIASNKQAKESTKKTDPEMLAPFFKNGAISSKEANLFKIISRRYHSSASRRLNIDFMSK